MKWTLRRVSTESISIIVVFALAACGARDVSSGTTVPLADTCRARLAPRMTPLEPAAPAPVPAEVARSSRFVVHVELKLAALAAELEGKVTPRLAEERNRPIGMAGHLNYTVDRGPFSVAVEGDSLVVRTDVRSHAQACHGNDCYASCDPQGRATATVPLRLTPEYRFAPSHVGFAFTRGCEVRALGGLLKMDVTPTIRAQLAPALRRVEQEIDGKLPQLRAQAERLWAELGKPRTLPLGGCVVTNPRSIVEGPVSGVPASPGGALRVRLGVVAYPEIRSRCGEPPAPRPLPPLSHDPALPLEDDLVLGLVSPLATVATGLEGLDPFDAGSARVRIARALAVPAGPALGLDLGLRGDACGDLGVRSPVSWTEDGHALRLGALELAKGERERLGAVSLAPDAFVRSLGALRFPPPIPPESLKDMVPTIASSMSDSSVDVSAKISSVLPLDVALRGEDLVANVVVRGSVELKQH